MSKKQRINRRARNARRRANQARENELLDKIRRVLEHTGCDLTGVGPKAVGVQGDARSYGISAIIRFPPDTTSERIAEISNLVTNRTREVTRVLMDIPLS